MYKNKGSCPSNNIKEIGELFSLTLGEILGTIIYLIFSSAKSKKKRVKTSHQTYINTYKIKVLYAHINRIPQYGIFF
jgi:glycopeptide antibiotics resistance protein